MGNIFEYTQGFFTKDINYSDEFKNSYYIITSLISSVGSGFYPASIINRLSKLSPQAKYNFFFHTIEKRNNPPYLKLFSKDKEKDSNIMRKIEKHFHCSTKTAFQYKLILESKGIDLYEVFGLERS